MPRNHPAAVLALAFCAMNPLPGAAAARALEPDSIKTITAEDAKRLSQDTRGRLLLDGLTALTDDAARMDTRRGMNSKGPVICQPGQRPGAASISCCCAPWATNAISSGTRITTEGH